MLDPIVKQLADDWDGKVKVLKLDVDDNPQLAIRLSGDGRPDSDALQSRQTGRACLRLPAKRSPEEQIHPYSGLIFFFSLIE